MPSSTSVTLLERVRHREDQAAWDRFVSLYTPLLYRWTTRAGISQEDSVDLIQDVFVSLLAELPRFEYDSGRGSFRGWLKTITVNKCRERQRKRALVTNAGSDVLPSLPTEDQWESFWDAEYREHLVRHALEIMRSQFETRHWQCCWETTVNGLSAAEVASRLGMSEAAVYVAKFRVLRRLRQELAGLLD